jgi:hypothetical protein
MRIRRRRKRTVGLSATLGVPETGKAQADPRPLSGNIRDVSPHVYSRDVAEDRFPVREWERRERDTSQAKEMEFDSVKQRGYGQQRQQTKRGKARTRRERMEDRRSFREKLRYEVVHGQVVSLE